MKIIEAMKKKKDLHIKAQDMRAKIAQFCANLDFETPTYKDQEEQVKGWLQAHGDIVQEIEDLQLRIQKTNLATPVTIQIGGNSITKSISQWVHRKRDLAALDLACWKSLSDRNLREGTINRSDGTPMDVKIRRYYKPEDRDVKVELYRSERGLIDAALEVVNATTELI